MAISPKHKKKLKKFGDHLKQLRKEKGLTMRELASRCDIDFQKINRIENHNINITLTTIFELAEGLEVKPSELLDAQFE